MFCSAFHVQQKHPQNNCSDTDILIQIHFFFEKKHGKGKYHNIGHTCSQRRDITEIESLKQQNPEHKADDVKNSTEAEEYVKTCGYFQI